MKMMINAKWIEFTRLSGLVILVIGMACSSFGQSLPAPARTVRKMDTYLEQLGKIGYSGSVLVAVNGKPVISKGYGFSDEERKLKNSPNTILDIGSVTKQFTAAAVLKLEMAGKLSTGDKIGKYFPNVPTDKADITIHNLLRHSAGLPSVVGGDFDKIGESEFIDKVFGSPLKFPVGTRFGYSNVGYSLLALIIEKVSGQSYERYLYENLWKPAGMELTGYSRPNFDKSLIAAGYKGTENWGRPTEKGWAGDAPYLHLKGNGGILSTTGDLFKWDRALTADKILSAEAKKKFFSPALMPDETTDHYYAYGWNVRKTSRGTRRISHDGTNRVFYAEFQRFVDEGVTIITITNRWNGRFNETGRIISRIIFEPDFEPMPLGADTEANRAYTEQLAKLAAENGAGAAVESYRKRDKSAELMGDVLINSGFDQIDEKKTKEAIEVFKLSTILFPKSGLAFDGLGEAYLESGDNRLAYENYKKSLQLDPENGRARDVVKRLGQQ